VESRYCISLGKGETPLTEKQFVRRLTRESITIRENGNWEFQFDDGNLFQGLAILSAPVLRSSEHWHRRWHIG
jgi:hypothetical protein